MKKTILLCVVGYLLVITVSAEQQVKSIKFFGGYISTTQALKVYNKTLEINPLDGLSKIIYAKAVIRVDIPNTNTRVYAHVNGNFCTPEYYNVPVFNSYLMNFDCTNLITVIGNYTVGMMTNKEVDNLYGEWEITYLNNPKGSFDFFGTEYWFGENGTIFLQLKDDNSLPVNTGSCDATIYYPDKTKWIDNFPMSYLNNSQGLYYLDFSVPLISGNYMVEANCAYDSLFIKDNPINISYDGTKVGNPNLDAISATDCIFYETAATTYQSVFFNISSINKNNITMLKPIWVGITAKTSQFEIYNYNTSLWKTLISNIPSSNNIICPAR